MQKIADTGLLKALLDRSDEHHRWAYKQFAAHAPFHTCEAVLDELASVPRTELLAGLPLVGMFTTRSLGLVNSLQRNVGLLAVERIFDVDRHLQALVGVGLQAQNLGVSRVGTGVQPLGQ